MRITLAALLVSMVAVVSLGSARASESGQILYRLHCSGCHGLQGNAATVGGIPALAGNVGTFMKSAESRTFLTQAPGIMNSGLNDKDVATLMNWLVPALAKGSLTEPFKPYSVEEIAHSRANRPPDFFVARRKVAENLQKRGYALPNY
ncbi:c-type cytochrome [Mesorhizobium retamae]|uniref:Cytochrome c n=1 Tax=Mesorhizobium retamae TaxID=2912854 RepID=A0ABS9QGN7_9HYPH|nr:cytochrome c [Mesorhizobium sp. IRAMC:0171]MCG7505926.1 cytochrome c [Mesorhizobium sp. IRAMC:0171]